MRSLDSGEPLYEPFFKGFLVLFGEVLFVWINFEDDILVSASNSEAVNLIGWQEFEKEEDFVEGATRTDELVIDPHDEVVNLQPGLGGGGVANDLFDTNGESLGTLDFERQRNHEAKSEKRAFLRDGEFAGEIEEAGADFGIRFGLPELAEFLKRGLFVSGLSDKRAHFFESGFAFLKFFMTEVVGGSGKFRGVSPGGREEREEEKKTFHGRKEKMDDWRFSSRRDEGGGENELHDKGEEEIDDENGERGIDHGPGGASPDANRSVCSFQPLIAGDDDNEDAEEESLGEGDGGIGEVDVGFHVVDPVGGFDSEDADADDPGGEHAECGRFGDEERDGDEHREEARGDEIVDGVDRHGAEGIDLLGDFHRSDFGSHRGANAAREHEAGDGGAELAKHGDGDESTGGGFEPEELELEKGLGGEDGTSEGAGDADDDLRARSDFSDLFPHEPEAFLAFGERHEDLSGQKAELPEVVDESEGQSSDGLEEEIGRAHV